MMNAVFKVSDATGLQIAGLPDAPLPMPKQVLELRGGGLLSGLFARLVTRSAGSEV